MSGMSMHKPFAVTLVVALCATSAGAESPGLGRSITAEELARYDISIAPDGVGLPPGAGSAAQGQAVYVAKCLACHGAEGAGKPNDQLVGGVGSLKVDLPAIKTVGSYWPYATTLFDYVRRAMPFNAPKSLTSDEVYGLTAYILHLNGVIDDNVVIDAHSLPTIQMPNRNGFVPYSPGK